MQDNKALAVRGLLAGAIAALIACTLYFFQVFEGLEYQLYDWNFRTSQQADAPAEIVIVAVDHTSLKRLGAWPWPRAYHAEVVRQVHRNGAKVMGVDFGFFEPDRRDPMNDEELAAATAEAGKVIYPVIMEEITVKGAKQMIRAEPLPEIKQAAAGLGHAHIEQSSDGIVRKLHLAYRTHEGTSWGLSLAVLSEYLDLPDNGIRIVRPGVLAVGDIEIPVTEAPVSVQPQEGTVVIDYEMHIAYFGDRGSFDYVPAHEVIEGRVPPNYFAGKIVLYGGKAAGLFDDHMTPFSLDKTPMPGVEI